MVRIIGTSPERVPIKDLGDVIYYKQVKDYTDDEYESSRALKLAEKQGKVTIVERFKTGRGSIEGVPGTTVINQQGSSLSLQDIKQAVKEILPENGGGKSAAEAVREAMPMIVDMVRQEISSVMSASGHGPVGTEFKGPEYIPDISTDGMKVKVSAEEKEVSSDTVDANLEALRDLKNKSQ